MEFNKKKKKVWKKKKKNHEGRSPCQDTFPAELLAVARRPNVLHDKPHVDQNILTLKLYLSNLG